jgi:hypothetical protein
MGRDTWSRGLATSPTPVALDDLVERASELAQPRKLTSLGCWVVRIPATP